MPTLSHIGAGLAAKWVTPKTSVLVLVLSALTLDILTGVFWFAGLVGILPSDNLVWSHGFYWAILWSVVAALLTARLYRSFRVGVVIGLLVFSHLVLDFLMWPPNASLLYAGGPEIGLDLGNSSVVAIAFEVGVLILGIVIYLRARATSMSTETEIEL